MKLQLNEHRQRRCPEGARSIRQANTPEYVAQKIFEGIESGGAEGFVHDWVNKASRTDRQ